MKYVLDTHALVWFLENNPKLGGKARIELQLPSSELFIPVIVLAEVCWMIEHRRTSIKSATDLFAALDEDLRIKIVPLTRNIVQVSTALREVGEMHDRQIVATAVNLLRGAGMAVTIITKDENIQRSGLVPVLW
jgi:PIN domain nuclease of toxin-antitoxin system